MASLAAQPLSEPKGYRTPEEECSMGDLAVAIVNLSRNAERRREARRFLRESVPVVATEILRHLRVGDQVSFRGSQDGVERDRIYRIERVGWDINEIEDRDHGYPGTPFPSKGASSLVLYRETHTLVPGRAYEGAVLVDVRSAPDEAFEISSFSDKVYRIPPGGEDERHRYDADLHLATDDELAQFASDAERVVESFNRTIGSEAAYFKRVAGDITKLAPK